MNPRAEKTRDYRHHGFTRQPHCRVCGATSGQSHDAANHAAIAVTTHQPIFIPAGWLPEKWTDAR